MQFIVPSGRSWLIIACLVLGGIAWVVSRLRGNSNRARAAEVFRAKVIGQLARGEPLEEVLALLTRHLEESCRRIRCTINLAGPVFSAADYPVEETPGTIFPIVDSSGSRIGVLTVQPPVAKLTREENKAIDAVRNLAAIIAEQRSMHGELQILDRQDGLTGLANEAFFAETLAALTKTDPGPNGTALFFFDLDGFSRLNDRLGRQAGDAYLRQAAERITKSFRSRDLIARLRADDFAALAQGLNSWEAERICRNLIDAFSVPFAIEGFQIIGAVRIGVTSFPGGGRSPEELRFSADAALSEAKRGDGSRFIVCSPEIRERTASVVNAGRQIRQARDASSGDLIYQPQMKIGGELAGMEAIVRIRRPEQGPVSAAARSKLAEDTSTVTEIYPWVLPEAMRQYAEWLHHGLNPVRIAVLVSRQELKRGDVLERIISCLKTFGLGPDAIQIELPEPAAALSDETLLHILRELRSASVSVTLDAFGAGFASPGCLDGLPVDAIKINRFFVGRLTEPDSSMSAVSAMIAGARILRMTTIAEGIETEEQMWALRKMGCDVLQGSHVAQPLSALGAGAALATRLKTHRAGRDWAQPASLGEGNRGRHPQIAARPG